MLDNPGSVKRDPGYDWGPSAVALMVEVTVSPTSAFGDDDFFVFVMAGAGFSTIGLLGRLAICLIVSFGSGVIWHTETHEETGCRFRWEHLQALCLSVLA